MFRSMRKAFAEPNGWPPTCATNMLGTATWRHPRMAGAHAEVVLFAVSLRKHVLAQQARHIQAVALNVDAETHGGRNVHGAIELRVRLKTAFVGMTMCSRAVTVMALLLSHEALNSIPA
jgi:hypothetical protein